MEKYEREIEELLRSMGEIGPEERGRQPSQPRLRGLLGGVRETLAIIGRQFTARRLFTAAALLLFAAFLFWRVLPRFAAYAGLVSLVLFIVALVALLTGERGGAGEAGWRGRPGQPLEWWIAWRLYWEDLRRRMNRWLGPY